MLQTVCDGAPDAVLPGWRRRPHRGVQLRGDQGGDEGLPPGRRQQGVRLQVPPLGHQLLQGGQGEFAAR